MHNKGKSKIRFSLIILIAQCIVLSTFMVLPMSNVVDADATPTWSYDTGAPARDVDVSDDGEYIAVGSYWNKLYLFHKNGTKLWEKNIPISNDNWPRTTHSVQISGDGNYIVAGDEGGVIHLYDRAGIELWYMDMGPNKVYSVAISFDGSYIVSASGTTVHCFSRDSNVPLWIVSTMGNVRNIKISNDGLWIAVSTHSATLDLYRNDILAGVNIWHYNTQDNYVNIDMSVDGQVVIVGEDDPGDQFGSYAYLFTSMRDGTPGWGILDGTPLWIFQQPDDIYTVGVSGDGNYVVVGGTNSHVDPNTGLLVPGGLSYLFHKDSGIPLTSWTTGTAASCDVTYNGKYVVIGSYNRNVYLLERDSPIQIWNYTTDGGVTAIAISPYFTLETDPIMPPYIVTSSMNDRKDILLEWRGFGLGGGGTIVAGSEDGSAYVFVTTLPTIDHYLIYRSEVQTGFDFGTIWVNTSTDINPTTGAIDPLCESWLDSNVTNIGHPDYRDEYYYITRAVYSDGNKSTTGNTAGYHVVHFGPGLNTFSPPLEPFGILSLDILMSDMGAATLSWLDTDDNWGIYPSDPAPIMQTGMGYVVDSPDPYYVFTGQPASMIIYQEGFGFDKATRDDVTATVDDLGNVELSWTPIAGADKYYIYKSNRRDGFFIFDCSVVEVASPPYLDIGAASIPGKKYYMIIPHNSSTSLTGSSAYSIGVITEEYNGNEMIGLPLKPEWDDGSADWLVDQVPNALGIVYLEDGIWKAHFKEFDEGVYDIIIELGRGYELTVYMRTFYTYVGH